MASIATLPAQLIVDVEDRSMLRTLKIVIKQLKGVTQVKENKSMQKTRYTEEEFYAKIDHSIQSAQKDECYCQKPGESVDAFVDRLLCIQ